MNKRRRFDIRGILANPDLRRELMVPTIQATQAREGIETTREQAERAYYVVTQQERIAFFDLKRFRGGKGAPDCRHEMFLRALRDEISAVRFDVARRDFAAIEGSPLTYRRIGLVAHIFGEAPALEPAWGIARQGKATGDDSRWLREWWETVGRPGWVPFAKGGEFSRFYDDVDLVIDWKEEHRESLKASGNALPSLEHYFKAGLTWPLRTVKGFNVRVMPRGCVFGHKGPAIIPVRASDLFFLLGVTNSGAAEYLLEGLTSVGSWEVGIVRRLPIPQPTSKQHESIATLSKAIHDAKSSWDEGNEISTRFRMPWLLQENLVARNASISRRLDRLTEYEFTERDRIQKLYAELNDEVYKLYGIPESTRTIFEETLGKRPPEVLWPQMEGRTVEQKRIEHVFRLLSFAVKSVVETDENGIVSFVPLSGQTILVERVHRNLEALFLELDAGQVETDIANELKKNVKGYRRVGSISQWLENAFFEYHCGLYENRPTIWHIASQQGTEPFAFGALVSYQRFDRNAMARLRGHYLREALESFRREAALATKAGQTDQRLEWQTRLEEAQELDRHLQWVQEGHHTGPAGGKDDYRILTPWKSSEERPKGWDPDIDDGVKVNIEPLQKAGVFRIAKVV